MRKLTFTIGILAVAAVALTAVTPASANCIPAKNAATFDPQSGVYAYWIAGPGADEASLKGRFWQQGNRAAGNEGTLEGFLYFFGAGVNMNANLGDAAVAGCPSVRLLTVAQVSTTDGGARFLAATIDETPTAVNFFGYENLGDLNMVEIPKIQVTSSSRSGSGVTLNFNVPTIGGTYGPGAATAIASVNILSAAGTTDPGRGAAAYTLLQSFPTTGGPVSGSVTVDCSNTAVDRFVVTQIGFEQGVGSDLVSRSVRVECDPTMADPNRDFKLIEGPKDKPRPARER